jgi:hypothetical protein
MLGRYETVVPGVFTPYPPTSWPAFFYPIINLLDPEPYAYITIKNNRQPSKK